MALIDHHDDIVTRAELAGDLLKAEDSRDDDLPDVLSQHGHQLFAGRSGFQIAHIGGVELRRDL